MPSDATVKSRTARYKERMNAAGFRQVNVWVHEVDRERFDQFRQTLVRPQLTDDLDKTRYGARKDP